MLRKCNRTTCETADSEHRRRVRWWNRVTQAYYCTPCARRINEHIPTKKFGVEPLCILHLPCDGCDGLFEKEQLSGFDFIPNDKRHLGPSESESLDLCPNCVEPQNRTRSCDG